MKPASDSEVQAPRGLVPLLLAVVPFSQIPLDAYTPAMPEMVRAFGSTSALIQNTVTAYMLGMSAALIPAGILSDSFGRKRVLLTGLAILIAASIACALATNISTLLALRVIQGIGGCSCLVVTYAIAADCFKGARLVAIAGLLGAAWGLAPVLAPAVGGLIVQFASWRVIFVVIAALAALVALSLLLFLPETLPANRRHPIDFRRTARVLGEALSHRQFLSFTLVFSVIASAQLVFSVVAPFLYQEQLGFTPAAYGLIALVLGGANLSGELACSTLAARVTSRQLCFGALAVFGAGAILLALTGTFQGATFWAVTLGGNLCARRLRHALPDDVWNGSRRLFAKRRTAGRPDYFRLLSGHQCDHGACRAAARNVPGSAGLDLCSHWRHRLCSADPKFAIKPTLVRSSLNPIHHV